MGAGRGGVINTGAGRGGGCTQYGSWEGGV